MSASLVWHDDSQRILICTLEADFGIETYAVLEGQLPMTVREVDHAVDIVFVLTAQASLPPLGSLLREINILLNVLPPNLRYVVGVGESAFLSNPASVWIASRLLPLVFRDHADKMHVASSLEAAIAFLQGASQ